MDLSILIPLYNYDCSRLLAKITQELEQEVGLRYEIILGNDCSSVDFTRLYEAYPKLYPHCIVLNFDKNRGASWMRNALAEQASSEQLLFFDSDVYPDDGTILHYLRMLREHREALICGGFYYNPKDLRQDNRLRYLYGTYLEESSLSERKQNPYQSFISMAFALPKSMLLAQPFPAIGMGYEDVLWVEILSKSGYKVLHVEAKVCHQLKESDEDFLKTLFRYVQNIKQYREAFADSSIPLLRYYGYFERLHLLPFLRSCRIFIPLLCFLIRKEVFVAPCFKLIKLVFLAQELEFLTSSF